MKRLRELDGMDLVAAYLHAMSVQESKTASALRLGVSIARLGEYRRGARSIPEHIQAAMRRQVLAYVMPEREALILSAALCPPLNRPEINPSRIEKQQKKALI